MKYLTTLLIPSVVHERVLLVVNSLAAKFAVGPNTRARPTCSPTIIEFLRYILAPRPRLRPSIGRGEKGGKYSRVLYTVALFAANSWNVKSDHYFRTASFADIGV